MVDRRAKANLSTIRIRSTAAEIGGGGGRGGGGTSGDHGRWEQSGFLVVQQVSSGALRVAQDTDDHQQERWATCCCWRLSSPPLSVVFLAHSDRTRLRLTRCIAQPPRRALDRTQGQGRVKSRHPSFISSASARRPLLLGSAAAWCWVCPPPRSLLVWFGLQYASVRHTTTTPVDVSESFVVVIPNPPIHPPIHPRASIPSRGPVPPSWATHARRSKGEQQAADDREELGRKPPIAAPLFVTSARTTWTSLLSASRRSGQAQNKAGTRAAISARLYLRKILE
ncbi:uncharacterized protein J3D65DRAFT_196142 [Phyllosticta citribraziliensis]|uniref:Uncharacterized protein n=1 Tax=Phyllosticta citribraziliensis TaxID=989973 RepID=A0ABR1M348_9PEZI